MSGKNELDAFIASGARFLGLTIRPEWQETIRLHLSSARSCAHGRRVSGARRNRPGIAGFYRQAELRRATEAVWQSVDALLCRHFRGREWR